MFTRQRRMGLLILALAVINILVNNLGSVTIRQPLQHFASEALFVLSGVMLIVWHKPVRTGVLLAGAALLGGLAITEAYLAIWS